MESGNIGFIFQFYNLIPVLTALENVELPLQLTNLNREERRKQALEAISQVGLNDRLTHKPGELWGVNNNGLQLLEHWLQKLRL